MPAAVLEQLNEAIDAVAAVDVDMLDVDALDEFVIGLHRARHRLAGATAAPLARWDATSLWRADGSRSAATRLARDGVCRCAPRMSSCAGRASCARCR